MEVLAEEARVVVEEAEEEVVVDVLKSLNPMHHELILQFKYSWKIYL